MPEVVYRSRIEASAGEVFAWHSRPGAFERLKPPWLSVEILQRTGTIKNGDRIIIAMKPGPLKINWVAEHRDYIEGRQFRDVQLKGPFAKWQHTHLMHPDGASACFLEDRVDFELPFGILGNLAGKKFAIRKLNRMFEYRHQVTKRDLMLHSNKGGKTMKVLISGASGLIGSALVPFLTSGGYEVKRLVRSKSAADGDAIFWDVQSETIDKDALIGIDAVVHLAGENLAGGRWTEKRKQKILNSRVKGTRLLSKTLAEMDKPPKVLVSASAIGYYGDRGDEVLQEDSEPGSGFLAKVCQEWEAAVKPAADKGIRVVNLRFGLVLSAEGGALKKMLLPFKMGVGGKIGSGDQYWSWIVIDDVVGAIHHAITHDSLVGPVNAVAPFPVTNEEFTRILGRILKRPTIFPLPEFAAKLALGEMADEMLLTSARVQPKKLPAAGYNYEFTDLEAALRYLLGKTK